MEIFLKRRRQVKVNIDELSDLKRGHLLDTRIIVAKMYTYLPKELKQEVNMADLQDAAMFHDYGKVLIPQKILNKDGELTPEERKIMDLHSEFGYELLKAQGVRESVLNLIKYHHQNETGTGYPEIKKDFEYSVSLQILKAADEYSALREKRSYKEELSSKEALDIIFKDVENGSLMPEVFEALKKAVA